MRWQHILNEGLAAFSTVFWNMTFDPAVLDTDLWVLTNLLSCLLRAPTRRIAAAFVCQKIKQLG